jgi:hypothetical protein
MALTTIKTGAISDDAVTEDKLANAINTARAANTAKHQVQFQMLDSLLHYRQQVQLI